MATRDAFDDFFSFAHQREEQGTAWVGTFADYLQVVARRPAVADLAHTRVFRTIERAGMEDGRYRFFASDLYGLDDVIEQIAEYFSAAAQGLDIRRRVLLLMGPPGGAKSETVGLLKRGIEEYSKSEEGALYAIAGCPLHEEPLHLLSEQERARFSERYGVKIEGDLCPVCLWRMDHEWHGNIAQVPVERVVLSEARRTGIGSFAPGDPKVVSLEDLVGGLDLVKVSEYGSESHPMAFDFRGAFEAASRGIMEFVEMLKAESSLLFPLLTLAQERQIKAGRFALFYADEVILSHSNQAEYERFAQDTRNEAIQNRTYVIRVPYVLKADDEQRIYTKMFRGSSTPVHVAPHTFKMAAYFAIATRLIDDAKLTPLAKVKLYNGEESAEHTQREIEDLRKAGREKGEGMQGVGPRQVVNALSQAVARKDDRCLSPIDALRALREVQQHTVGNYDAGRAEELLKAVIAEYTDIAQRDVQQAFVEDFDEAAQTLLLNYLDNAQAFLNQDKMEDPITGEQRDPDEKLMRAIESYVHVTDTNKKEFRQEVLMRVGALSRRDQSFRWDSHPRLKEAIEKKLFADLSGTLKVTISAPTPDKEQRDRIESVRQKLIEKHDYCPSCAEAVLRFVGHALNR